MSIHEVHSLLKLGHTGNGSRFCVRHGYGTRNWHTETAIIKQVHFRHGVQITFWTDLVTDQSRVFVESEVAIQDGKLVLIGGAEIAPAVWN